MNLQTRGKYARMSVELDMSKTLVSKVILNGRTIFMEYESLHFICFNYGCYGHINEHSLE